jgi:hypothetical protein
MSEGNCEGMNPSHPQGSFHFGSLESWWTPKFSKNDFKGQNPKDWRVLISLEIYWNVDVQNGLAWLIWTLKTQVMVKIKAKSQINNLIPDH